MRGRGGEGREQEEERREAREGYLLLNLNLATLLVCV